MTRKLQMVFAVTLVLVLALSSGVWAAPSGTQMSKTIEADINVTGELVIDVQDLATNVVANQYDLFTVGFNPAEDLVGKQVRVKITADLVPAQLEYLEQTQGVTGHGEYHKLTFNANGETWFGPSEGFSLTNNTATPSFFRVTYGNKQPLSQKPYDVYSFTIEVVEVGGDTLGSYTGEVHLYDGPAISLSWAEGRNPSGSYSTNENIDVGVDAGEAGASHVDKALYLIEVKKGESAAVAGTDFTIYDPNFQQDNPEGIMDTFVNGVGFWGPETGFLFDGQATTEFGARIHNGGSYHVKVWAIQLHPEGSETMGENNMPTYWHEEMQ